MPLTRRLAISVAAAKTLTAACTAALTVVACSRRVGDEAHEVAHAEPAALSAKPPSPLVVHEWGTFTSMQGLDGASLDGLQHESEALPAFVHSRTRSSPSPFHAFGDDSLDVPALHVTGKMETPVMYFHSASAQHVDVHVDFAGGVMTQWYPRATALPALDPAAGPLDVATIATSSLDWSIELTPFEAGLPTLPRVADDDPWAFAREVRAASVTTGGAGAEAESERYLFYRGLGHLELPVQVLLADERMTVVRNCSGDAIPAAILLDVGPTGARFRRLDPLAAHGGQTVQWGETPRADGETVVAALQVELSKVLVEQGLFEDEARAMVRTWSRTWFADPGTRVLYIEPRALIERVLPLRITPAPQTTVRVLVGRQEVLTRERQGSIEAALRDRLSTSVAVRDAATHRLALLGRFLEPAVRLVGASSADPELRKSAEAVLAAFTPAGS